MSHTEGVEQRTETAAWRVIEEEFLANGQADRVHGALTQARDALAGEAYRTSIERVLPQSVAMLAVGAYGRRETFPFSPLDIVIVLESGAQPDTLKGLLPEFVRLLWDAGLRPNCTVLSVGQCVEAAEQGGGAGVNLLGRRFLVGDSAVYEKLEAILPAALAAHSHKMSQHLCQLARARHARYRNTPHHAEPDVKEGPGGIEDLRLIDSLAILKAEHGGPADPPSEAALLVSAACCFAQFHAGRDHPILDFEAQETLARQPFARGKSPQQWMREYFQSARTIFNTARRAIDGAEKSRGSLLETFLEQRSRLSNSEFTVSRERLLLRNPAQLAGDPMLAFRMLEFIARHGVPPAPETERRLEASREAFAAYCAQPRPSWSILKSALGSPHAVLALRVLDTTGLLPALFPEWGAIEHLVVPDAGSRYTTDEYTLTVIERMSELRSAAHPERIRFAELLSEIDDLALLVFALLFHELGQGAADPLQAAVERAREAMARIQMPPEAHSTVEFLILHQADLSDAMSGRDLDDPATARLLADRIGTVERLKLLAVMTYAKVSAGTVEARVPWRLEQLWRAYVVTRHELMRELETDRIQQVPENLPAGAEFIKGFPSRYLQARSPREIEDHLQLFQLSRPTGVAARLDPVEGAYRLTVVARDKPSLFASFAGAISSFGLDILKAEAFGNAAGVVLDTFVFSDPKRLLQQNPPEADRLKDLIQRIALDKTDVRRLMRGRAAPDARKRSTAPQVQFDSEACPTATLVEISAEDRPGLLYSLATVFSSNSCNIDVVLVDTKGQRAIDVFYVAQEGRKLSPGVQTRLKEQLLAAC